jgi:hypothetical protein
MESFLTFFKYLLSLLLTQEGVSLWPIDCLQLINVSLVVASTYQFQGKGLSLSPFHHDQTTDI